MTDIDKMVHSLFYEGNQTRRFHTDIRDKGSSCTLEAELPGFRKEDITVDIDGDQLTVAACRDEDSSGKDPHYLRRERYYGSYSRSFDISQFRAEDIRASYHHGILKLELPRKNDPEASPRHLEIQ